MQASADFQVLRVARRWDAERYVQRLEDHPPPRADAMLWRDYVDSQRRALEGLASWTPMTFLCVRLAEPEADLHTKVSRTLEQSPTDVRDSVREWWARERSRARVWTGRLDERAIAARLRTAEQRVSACLDARPAAEEEIQWLIRRAYMRGVGDPHLVSPEVFDHPWEERVRSMEWWLDESVVERQHRYLRVVSEHGEAYQAGICLGEMGDGEAFSREVELMFAPLEEFDFPVDASLNVRWVGNEQAKRQARSQFRRNANELEEADDAEGAMEDDRERAALARELHHRLSRTGEPVLFGTLSLIVSAPDRDEMEARLRALRENLPHRWYRPVGDQLPLFLQHLPGQRARTIGYERLYTCEQVGAMVPHATHEAGSDTADALYIARTLHGGQPVLFDLREASGTDKAPTIALVGSLGGGKTMFLQLLQYQAFLQGARIVDIDPKDDHRWHLLPEVAPHVEEIVLGPDPAHRGKLDPLRTAPASERHDAAATFLIDVLPKVSAEIEAAISGAIGRVMDRDGERACCTAVVEELEGGDSETERTAGYLLRQYCDVGTVQLGFAFRGDPLPSESGHQVTYVQCRALKRSNFVTVRSEMTQAQRHGRAVLQLLGLFAMRILGDDRQRLKVLSFDEASFLSQDALGQQLLDQLARWGRSELAVPIISTQLLGDVADLDNLIGSHFLFGMRSRDHARRALASIELDADGPLAEALTERYGAGRCLYRDLQGRCEEVQIDLASRRLLESLSTTPQQEDPIPTAERVA